MDTRLSVVQEDGEDVALTDDAKDLYREMGVRAPDVSAAVAEKPAGEALADADAAIRTGAGRLAWISVVDIGVFFAVLLVGFAYVWKRGDFDWVRAIRHERRSQE